MSIILLGILTGIDNFLVSAGLGTGALRRFHRAALVVAFAVCEAFMPLVGFLMIGQMDGEALEWLGPVMLILAGLLVLYRVFTGRAPKFSAPTNPWIIICAVPVLLSLDNLAAGAALGALGGFDISAAMIAGAIAAGISLVGLWLGGRIVRLVPIINPQVALACCLIAVALLELAADT